MTVTCPKEDHYLDTIHTREESLVLALEAYLKKGKTSSKQILIRELDCWQGRADMVKADIKGSFDLSEKQMAAIINLTNTQIISLLHYRAPRTLNYIKSRTGLMEKTIKKSLKELETLNVIFRTEDRNYRLNEKFAVPKVTFNAYEAKLYNWRRALYQAVQYLGFSQYSWVVMPEKNIKPALKNLYVFKANGIGLIGIKENGEVVIHLKAKKYQPSKKAFHLVGVGKTIMKMNQM